MWLDPNLLGDISNVPSTDLLPSIRRPLSRSSFPLVRLLSLCKVALQHNFTSSLLTIASGVMKLHYRKIVEVRKFFYKEQNNMISQYCYTDVFRLSGDSV